MNGRCETDWIDEAVDVCDRCYREFCSTCLVELPGRKHPLCLDCALTRSGARQGRSPKPAKGAKASAKKRRKELKERKILASTEKPRVPSIAGVAAPTVDQAIDNKPSVVSARKADPATRAYDSTSNEAMDETGYVPVKSKATTRLAQIRHSRATEPQDLDLLRGRIQQTLTHPETSKPPRPLSRAERAVDKPSDIEKTEPPAEIPPTRPNSVAVRGNGRDTAPFVGMVRYVNTRPKAPVGVR